MNPIFRAMLLGALHGAIAERRASPRGVELHAWPVGAEVARVLRSKLQPDERRWVADVAAAVAEGLA